ncbi:hypothetical protein [Enterococcus sp. DIV1420a]|uniref:hypothetical protein n=1 Tax=Enterococcus sp. DIV1420a TaxID=2774672 RepID=UPI003F23932E
MNKWDKKMCWYIVVFLFFNTVNTLFFYSLIYVLRIKVTHFSWLFFFGLFSFSVWYLLFVIFVVLIAFCPIIQDSAD